VIEPVPDYEPFDRPLAPDDPYRRLEGEMGIVRAVRVVCDGCGRGVMNTHASSVGESGEAGWVAACVFCGSGTAQFYDHVLVLRDLAAKYRWEEAA
jgi:hypothetical protein